MLRQPGANRRRFQRSRPTAPAGSGAPQRRNARGSKDGQDHFAMPAHRTLAASDNTYYVKRALHKTPLDHNKSGHLHGNCGSKGSSLVYSPVT